MTDKHIGFTYDLYPVIINSNSLVSNQYNNTYTYKFPSGAVKFEGSKVAVSSVSIFYSWFNISSSYGNNSFQFTFPKTGGTDTYTVTIPNGNYEVSDLNSYLQSFCITNGLYLINSTGNYVYYLEFVANSNFYAVQFNSFPVPTSLPTGWTAPSNWHGYPAVAQTPQLIVLNNNFRTTIGYNAGTYPSVVQSTTYSTLSTSTPELSPVQSVILSCSLLNNKYSIPNTILYSFSPAGVTFGSLIQSSPQEMSFIAIQDGNYPDFTIQFLDQSFNPITINDTNLVVQLIIATPNK